MSAFEVYVLFQLDSIINLFNGMTVLFGVGVLIFSFIVIIEIEDERIIKKAIPILIKLIVGFIVCGALGSFIPSTKTAAAMYVIPAVVNNEKARQLPDKLLDLVNEKLDELMKGKDDK